jgi:hypothetical protein
MTGESKLGIYKMDNNHPHPIATHCFFRCPGCVKGGLLKEET